MLFNLFHLIHGKNPFRGTKTARIKKYTENRHGCNNCKNFDVDVRVYRQYYHFCFIPVIPIGPKFAKMKCNHCGQPVGSVPVQNQYEDKTWTPIYLYAIPVLIAGVIALAFLFSFMEEKQKVAYVDNPKVGDVYQIKKDQFNLTTYSFLRIARINGDTLIAYHNHLEYLGYVSKFSEEDFFMKDDELFFSKSQVKEMLDKAEINAVERDYGNEEGFNRIR